MFSRREFLINSLLALLSLNKHFRKDLPSGQRLPIPDKITPRSREWSFNEFMTELNSEYNNVLRVIETSLVFENFNGFPRNMVRCGVAVYYPAYAAVYGKYNIGPEWTFVNHLVETGMSSHPEPDNKDYVGCMQRSGFYDDGYVDEAVRHAEFLRDLPGQRYTKTKGFKTDDYREIMFFGKKIHGDADEIMKRKSIDFDSAVKEAQFRYSSQQTAEYKIYLYEQIADLFKAVALPIPKNKLWFLDNLG